MEEKLTYTGRVDENGKAILPAAKMRQEIARLFAGKEIEVRIMRRRKHRSDNQNRYYWGVVVPMIQAGIKDMGDVAGTDEVHELLKARFLGRDKIDQGTGEFLYRLPGSTASLSTVEFLEYIAHCQQFAAEYLGVIIPDPDGNTN